MKNIYLIIGAVVVLINSLIGLIFSSYQTFNWLTSDVVIIINALLLHFLSHSKISDGFKVASTFIFPILGLISFSLSLKLENKLENNISLVGILILTSIQIIILIIANSLKTDKK
jgi:peptidoglycan/LPS O-acetylase OafA/YrhL